MKALRHQHDRQPQEFDVIKHNDDGTVDLGHGKELVIGSCIVSDSPKPGTCTLVKEAKTPRTPKGNKQPTPEEKAAALAEAKKQLAIAQDAAAAAPNDENLAARVKELTDAVEELES